MAFSPDLFSCRLHLDIFDERLDHCRFLIAARCRTHSFQPEMGDFIRENAQIRAFENNLLRGKGQHKPFGAIHRLTTAMQKMMPWQQPVLAV